VQQNEINLDSSMDLENLIQNYYDCEPKEIKLEITKKENDMNFSLLLWNIRSIKSMNKFTKFKFQLAELVSNKHKIIDFIAITESWINELDDFKLYELKNYHSVMLSRNLSSGGGITLYVRKGLAINVISKMSNSNVEAVFVDVMSSNLKQKILVVYRPPSGNLINFYDLIEDILNVHENVIIVGDMNINILNQDRCKQYKDLLLMQNYEIVNNGITRSISGTLIDHILLEKNRKKNVKVYTSKNTKLSDHNFVVLMLDNFTHQKEWKQMEISKLNYEKISNDLISIDFNAIVGTGSDVNLAFNKLIMNVQTIIKNAQLTYKMKHKLENVVPPFVDQKYVKISNNINNLYDKIRKMKSQRLPVDLLETKLSLLEDDLKRHTDKKAQMYYSNMILNSKISSWTVINEITGRIKKAETFVIQTAENVLFDKKDIAEIFQSKFSSVVCHQPNECTMKFLGEPLINTIMLQTVTESDVFDLINDMSIRKATGSDKIPSKIWKDNAGIFTPPLTVLINNVIENGVYPDILKIASIKPIHKGGSKTSVDNYRGISLLPTINKIIERILYEQIEGFILKYKQYDDFQYGYRRHYGTQDALCKLLSTISKGLDKNKAVVAVFFDVSKAFDSINHKTLLFKIHNMGIRGTALKLIRNYLMNRFQFVKISDAESLACLILNGVPQGSNLGPLLFNMMLYDLKFVQTVSEVVKFADDIVMVMTCEKNGSYTEILKKDIDEIKAYYKSNGLSINLSKSKYMTFGVNSTQRLDELMSDNYIEKVEIIRYLGVTLDERLKFDEHANNLVSKLSQSVNAMKVINNYLPTCSKVQFYNAFVGSHIFYSGFLLCRMSCEDINRLQRIQNKALKIAYNLDMRFSTLDLYMKVATNVLPVTGIAYLNLLLLVKKQLISQKDTNNDFVLIPEGRRKLQIKFVRYSKNILARDITCLGPTIYNQLPLEIREIRSYNTFKKKLKSYLIDYKQIFLRGNTLDVNKLFRKD